MCKLQTVLYCEDKNTTEKITIFRDKNNSGLGHSVLIDILGGVTEF